MARCKSGRAKCCNTSTGRLRIDHAVRTNAIATGTIGQRKLTSIESVHELRKQILRNFRGWRPRLPLSPSGWIPGVTSCPLWLNCGRCILRRPEELWGGGIAPSTFGSVVYSWEGRRLRLSLEFRPMVGDLGRGTEAVNLLLIGRRGRALKETWSAFQG